MTATLILHLDSALAGLAPLGRRRIDAPDEAHVPFPEPAFPSVPIETGAALPVEEAAWARAAAAGDRVAFGRLYDRFAPMVHGVLLAMTRPSAADDLVQEVFLKALRHLDEIRTPESVGGWLRTIARNVARDAHRAARDPEGLPDDLAAPVAAADGRDAREVLDTVRSLPEAYRETLTLRLVEGMTGPEISLRTGLTPGSVRVNLCRGMKMLLQRLKDRGWTT